MGQRFKRKVCNNLKSEADIQKPEAYTTPQNLYCPSQKSLSSGAPHLGSAPSLAFVVL